MFLTGEGGCVQLRRSTGDVLESVVTPADVNTVINRFGFDGVESNVVPGDRVEISTDDPRGLVFIDPSWWPDGVVHHSAMFYAHVNAAGGMRIYRSFSDAINNDRGKAASVATFAGSPVPIRVDVRDTGHHPLGGVAQFTFNTDRSAVDTTSLGDLFTEHYSAGTLTGSGTLDCYFQASRQLCSKTNSAEGELSMLLPQIIMRTELGAQFDAILQMVGRSDSEQAVFYELRAIATRTGITVTPTGLIQVAMDFVTTGEFRLRIGDPAGYILKEDFDRIAQEQDLDFLLMEPTD
jgi:hypothetical protein